jgi:hypothetical protein
MPYQRQSLALEFQTKYIFRKEDTHKELEKKLKEIKKYVKSKLDRILIEETTDFDKISLIRRESDNSFYLNIHSNDHKLLSTFLKSEHEYIKIKFRLVLSPPMGYVVQIIFMLYRKVNFLDIHRTDLLCVDPDTPNNLMDDLNKNDKYCNRVNDYEWKVDVTSNFHTSIITLKIIQPLLIKDKPEF